MSIVHSHCFLSNCEKKNCLISRYVPIFNASKSYFYKIKSRWHYWGGLKLWISHNVAWHLRGAVDLGMVWNGMVYVWALLNEFSERQTVTKCLGQARGVIMVIEEKRTKRVWAPQKDYELVIFSENEIIIYYEFMWLKIIRSLSSSFCSGLLGQLIEKC